MIVVTTDHGRADGFAAHGGNHPESARVWLAAAGAGVAARGGLDFETPRRLSDVNPTVRRFLGLPPVSDGVTAAPLAEIFAAQDEASVANL
jgi:arylsulfatase A-like enzyme